MNFIDRQIHMNEYHIQLEIQKCIFVFLLPRVHRTRLLP